MVSNNLSKIIKLLEISRNKFISISLKFHKMKNIKYQFFQKLDASFSKSCRVPGEFFTNSNLLFIILVN